MKNQDKFGYDIYDGVFRKMLNYAKRLEEIGFQESHSKPNLLYYISERFSVFADMRGYKDDWGRFIPIWDKERKGKPQFYHQITNYNEKYIGEINRNYGTFIKRSRNKWNLLLSTLLGNAQTLGLG